jgi:hypothetical protein
MDAEQIGIHLRFDKILCQYALMFFPNATEVLSALRHLLEQDGKLCVAVHGTPQGVPYFSTIMEPIVKFIPDIRPLGAPNVHRFGEPRQLENALGKSGYRNIAISTFTFEYEAGSFEDYWQDYLATTANSIRKRIEREEKVMAAIKANARDRVRGFLNNGRIVFPWDVLIASASR